MPESDEAVYVISVAAELAGCHPQTLRMYERKGLVDPARTTGNTRRYSAEDIARLRRIQDLTQSEGLNLAGVRMVLDLEQQVTRLRRRLDRMADRMAEMEEDFAREVRDMAREAGAILPAAAHHSLDELLELLEKRGRRPIPLGPPGQRNEDTTGTNPWTSTG